MASTDLFAKESFGLPQTSLKSDGWRLENSVKLKLLERILAAGTPLGEYVKGRFYRGIVTGFNEAFVVDRVARGRLIADDPSSAEVLKPFIRGRDVKRWRVEPQDLWLIFTRRGIDVKKYPAILDHLKKYKKQLIPGVPGGRKPGSYEWYEIQDNIAYWQEFEHPKIIYPDIARRCEFALESGALYPDCTLFLIPEGSPATLAILNSSVVAYVYPNICPKIRGDFMRFKSIYVEQIPIPKISQPNRETISTVANYLISLNRLKPSDRVEPSNGDSPLSGYFEGLLNDFIYELFFPDDLHSRGINLFKQVEEAQLPAVADTPAKQRLSRLEEIYERISNDRHPIRGCLESLKSLEVVRIIEGEE